MKRRKITQLRFCVMVCDSLGTWVSNWGGFLYGALLSILGSYLRVLACQKCPHLVCVISRDWGDEYLRVQLGVTHLRKTETQDRNKVGEMGVGYRNKSWVEEGGNLRWNTWDQMTGWWYNRDVDLKDSGKQTSWANAS